MLITSLMPLPKQRYTTALGTPLVGGKVHTYAAGTTNPKATYTDAAGTEAQPNPIPLNLRGEPDTPIFWSGNYRVDVRDALGNLVYSVDNYNTDPAGVWSTFAQLIAAGGSALVGFLQAGAGAVKRLVQDKLRESVSSTDFGAKGDFDIMTGVGTDDTDAVQRAIAYCSLNQKILKQIGISKITKPLDWSDINQLEVVGAGAVKTFDSGWAYVGEGTMVEGRTVNKSLAFANFRNMVFEGPGAGVAESRAFYGDFYHGGARGCIFRNWETAVMCFGTLNTFKDNRFLSCVDGLVVTNWPAGSDQENVSTTTFLSEQNNYYGCSGTGLKIDTTTTGAANIVSSASRNDTFEQNGRHFYLNKAFSFILDNPHFEFSSGPVSYEVVNSVVTIINPYTHPGDVPKVKFIDTFAPPNSTGHNEFGNGGILTRQMTLSTHAEKPVTLAATDEGGLLLAGAKVTGIWTPVLGSTGGTSSGNEYGAQEGTFYKIGNLCICTFRIALSAKDAGMGGAVTISGLPFPADAAKYNAYGNALRFSGVTLGGGAGVYTQIICDVFGSMAYPVKLSPSGLAPVNIAPAELSDTATLSGTLIYLAA